MPVEDNNFVAREQGDDTTDTTRSGVTSLIAEAMTLQSEHQSTRSSIALPSGVQEGLRGALARISDAGPSPASLIDEIGKGIVGAAQADNPQHDVAGAGELMRSIGDTIDATGRLDAPMQHNLIDRIKELPKLDRLKLPQELSE